GRGGAGTRYAAACMLPLFVWPLLLLGGAPSIDPDALQQHLDEVIPARLEQTGVPGVVVSVVQGDRVLLVRGWGLADVEAGTPMDGERTVVRVASISKTFTATAIAQLEARGSIELDTPVDDYLDGWTIPGSFASSVTLRHLLSHSAGIINNNVGRVSRIAPHDGLAPFLRQTMPPQLRPPGVAVVYSNHGNALAGLVVEEVTGRGYADYVHDELLGPLRMGSSSFERRPAIEQRLATGYTLEHGELVPYEYLYFKTVPASALHTTAADMAHYMVMHLQEGRFEGRAVLPPDAARRMEQVVPAIHPALPSYHYAFAHAHTAGHPTRSHGGSVPAFLSRLVLFDEYGVGVFVCQNSFGESLTTEVVESIAQRFLPPPSLPLVTVDDDGRPRVPEPLVGDYRRLDKGDTPAFTRAITLLWPAPLQVRLDDEGFLTVDGDRFVQTGPHTFHRERAGRQPEALVFLADAEGQIRWVHRGLSSAERVPWHASRWIQLPLVGVVVLVLLAAARSRRGVSSWAAALALVGLLGPHLYVVAWVDAGQVAYLRPLRFGAPGWLRAALWLVPLAAALAWVGVLAQVRSARASSSRGRQSRDRQSRGRQSRDRQSRDRQSRGRQSRGLGWSVAVAMATSALVGLAWYWATPSPGLVAVP
ncbi:MAG: serine hydrolase domain-containing protein, partial [Myxococcota bacterium]